MRSATHRYHDAFVDVARRVLGLYARVLDVPAGTFPLGDDVYTTLVVNDHPTWTHDNAPDASSPDEEKLLLLEHTDGSALTVLHQQGDYAGLQGLAPDGTWIPVPIRPGALQVFTGTLLTHWTEGRLSPGRHRVVAGGSVTRRSSASSSTRVWTPSSNRCRPSPTPTAPTSSPSRCGSGPAVASRSTCGVRPTRPARGLAGEPPLHRRSDRLNKPKETPMTTFPTARDVRTTPEGLLWEPSARWVRGLKGEVTVVDSRHPVLVWEPGVPVPLYAFPRAEVREDLLRPAKNPPTGTHTGSRIFYDLDVDGETLANAAWTFPSADLADHIAFEWFRRAGRGLDHWYEEEEEIFIHPRDPHKRVDAIPSSRHLVVEIDGTVVADTRRPVLLFETGLPTRYYIPREDVRLDLLEATDLSTGCPYKGTAEYWSWRGEADVPPNLVWSYPEPLPAVGAVRGLLAFYNEVVDIVLDGERVERPVTHFSDRLTERARP